LRNSFKRLIAPTAIVRAPIVIQIAALAEFELATIQITPAPMSPSEMR
jgi:hypothetical protein